ncbi:hypothetical protein [Cognatilysobacter lacus]|uniref:hypothetical protein n=1 Tax=Cognatilysobacter lacus TaxID=1643323 RepID=UPI001F1C2DEB|nr:hypothetical protein [Lysobacter lacus]
MFRRLLVPLAATALLAGCVTTSPYGYRDGQGDYYYGAPSVEYRYGNGYGDPYYGPYRPGFSIWGGSGYYGRPYYGPGYGYPGYGYPYYGNPYYGNPYYGGYYGYPHQRRPRPDNDGDRDDRGHQPDGGPWRNLDEINRRRHADGNPGDTVPRPAMPQPPPQFTPPRPVPRSDDGDSPARQVIRRAGRRSNEQDQ